MTRVHGRVRVVACPELVGRAELRLAGQVAMAALGIVTGWAVAALLASLR